MTDQRSPRGAGLESWSLLSFRRRHIRRVARAGRQFPDDCSAGNFDDDILSRGAIHAFAETLVTVFGKEFRLIILPDQIVEIMIGFENHVAAAATVAAVGTTFGTVLLAAKRHA